MSVVAILRRNCRELIIKGLRTHVLAEVLCRELSDMLLSKDLSLNYFFNGELGSINKGMTIKIIFNRELSKHEVLALEKFFSIRGIKLIHEINPPKQELRT